MVFEKVDNVPVISVKMMRESDEYTIENFTDSKTLMKRAALGIYNSCSWTGNIAIVTGSGNNGGDGYALAGILAKDGICSDIIRLSERFSADGRYYFDLAVKSGVRQMLYDENMNFDNYDIIVDCIFGTGFTGEPRGACASAIRKINSSGAFVVSADINSGLNGDTGEAFLAVKSDLTVSIGYYKTGMFKNDGINLIGKLVNADIGIILKPEE